MVSFIRNYMTSRWAEIEMACIRKRFECWRLHRSRLRLPGSASLPTGSSRIWCPAVVSHLGSRCWGPCKCKSSLSIDRASSNAHMAALTPTDGPTCNRHSYCWDASGRCSLGNLSLKTGTMAARRLYVEGANNSTMKHPKTHGTQLQLRDAVSPKTCQEPDANHGEITVKP